MTDQSKFEVKFEKGDRLVHPRGATAEVLDVAKHKHDKGTVYGYRLRITQTDGKVQESTIPLMQFSGKGWRLSLPAEEAAEQKPATTTVHLPAERRIEEDADRGVLIPVNLPAVDIEVAAEPVVAAEPEVLTDSSPRADLRKQYNDYKARSDKDGLASLAYTDWLETKHLTTVEWEDQRVVRLEEQLDDMREQRDSAIKELDTANQIIEERNQRVNTGMVAPSTAAPCKEFKIMHGLTGESLAREEKEGWEVEYMQFTEDSTLHVVYYRIVSKLAPQPEHASAKVFAPTAILETAPLAEAAPVLIEEEADLIGVHARAAAEVSPIDRIPLRSPPPRFNKQAYLSGVAADLMQTGQQIYEAVVPQPVHPLRPELASQTPVRG